MVSIELVRAAGIIADTLDLMGFSDEQSLLIADLLKKQIRVRENYSVEKASEKPPVNAVN